MGKTEFDTRGSPGIAKRETWAGFGSHGSGSPPSIISMIVINPLSALLLLLLLVPPSRRLQFQAVRIWIVYHYVHRSRLLRLRRRFRAAANEELLLSSFTLGKRGPPLTEDKSSMGSPPLWPSSPLLDTLPFFLSRRRSTVIGIQ